MAVGEGPGVREGEDAVVDDGLAASRDRRSGQLELRPGDRVERLEALVMGRTDRRDDGDVRRREPAEALDRARPIGAHLDDEVAVEGLEPLAHDAGDAHGRVDGARRDQRRAGRLEDMAEDVLGRGLAVGPGDADHGRREALQLFVRLAPEALLDAILLRLQKLDGGDEGQRERPGRAVSRELAARQKRRARVPPASAARTRGERSSSARCVMASFFLPVLRGSASR